MKKQSQLDRIKAHSVDVKVTHYRYWHCGGDLMTRKEAASRLGVLPSAKIGLIVKPKGGLTVVHITAQDGTEWKSSFAYRPSEAFRRKHALNVAAGHALSAMLQGPNAAFHVPEQQTHKAPVQTEATKRLEAVMG